MPKMKIGDDQEDIELEAQIVVIRKTWKDVLLEMAVSMTVVAATTTVTQVYLIPALT